MSKTAALRQEDSEKAQTERSGDVELPLGIHLDIIDYLTAAVVTFAVICIIYYFVAAK